MAMNIMRNGKSSPPDQRLGLRAGEWVEIRSEAEILATLDEQGQLDGLPFMPEMLQFCGQRVRVHKVAHKTCDTIKTYNNRYMPNAVHLDGLRCNGAAHGGCQARCLLFWKEAWLRRSQAHSSPGITSTDHNSKAGTSDKDRLFRHTRQVVADTDPATEIYSCQATRLRDATALLHWYDPRPYFADLRSGNVSIAVFTKYVVLAMGRAILRRLNRDPALRPGLGVSTSTEKPLNLQPGEMVRVRSREEIYRTIGANRKNRGLWYDIEMEAFSGESFPVLARVERLLDERTGKMIELSRDCIMLDGAVCGGCRSMNRLFCPRAIYPYWREVWLERVS
jgi:hypothetical protein